MTKLDIITLTTRYLLSDLKRRTGIPMYRLRGIQTGLYKGYPREWKILEKFYQDVQYRRMRMTGVPKHVAMLYKTKSFDEVQFIIQRAKEAIDYVSTVYGVDREAVRWAYIRSGKPWDVLLQPWHYYPERL